MNPDNPAERHQQYDARHVGHHAGVRMYEVMAEDRGDDTQDTHEDDARNVREPGSDVRDGLATEHEIRGQEPDIHDDDDADDEQGAERSELPPPPTGRGSPAPPARRGKMVRTKSFEQNHTLKRPRAVPCRASAGIG